MADRIIIINGQPVKLIPLGECACGCGGKTKISPHNVPQYGWIKGQPRKYILGHNSKMENHPMWNGGRTITPLGYVQIYQPSHPRANPTGYIFEHILVAEEILCNPFPDGFIVHHDNEICTDNSPENLVICTRKEHAVIHRRRKALAMCGYANWRKCKICHHYDDPINLVICIRGNGYETIYHRLCHNKKEKEYKQSKLNTPCP